MAEGFADQLTLALHSPSGLRFELGCNAALRRIDFDSITLTLFVGNDLEDSLTNLYLRRHSSQGIDHVPLLGPRSRTAFRAGADGRTLVGTGQWRDIGYRISLLLALQTPAWFWHVQLENTGSEAATLDLTYTQDVALAPYGALRLNEYYASQYIDHTPLRDPGRGVLLASRQNLPVDGRNPWCLIGSLRSGESFATDALQFHGLAGRAAAIAPGIRSALPSRRLQHEHSMVALRETSITLSPGQHIDTGFHGTCLGNHPAATSASDLAVATATLALPEGIPPRFESTADSGSISTPSTITPAVSLFSSAVVAESLDLDETLLHRWFGPERRHEELDEAGMRLSFFCGPERHVVLRAKELRVLRAHGHLLRTGDHLTPDESALTSTAWMSGVFHSMLTQGHVSINRFLSTAHSYIGLFRSHGQRIFVDIGGAWQLLQVPSAFEMAPDSCRWIYRLADRVLEVRSEAQSAPHELTVTITVLSGDPCRCLISHHVALNGDDGSVPGPVHWRMDGAQISAIPAPDSELARRFPNGSFQLAPLEGSGFERVGGDELLFLDGRSRGSPFLCIVTRAGARVGLRIRGNLLAEEPLPPMRVGTGERLIPDLALSVGQTSPLREAAGQMAEIVPWLAQNALVHYLSPRGLEQYSGGGWGTRDVCQGPVELLLALGHTEPIRDLLLRVMAMQNPDGDWPQWFMFFDRERNIRAADSHGDIIFWPLLVVSQYLLATGDAAILDEPVRFFDAQSAAAGEQATVWQHVQRALRLIGTRVIPGTSLAAYGHGDWNDSLQPVDPVMPHRMCSAWTVTLHYQALRALAHALRTIGRDADTTELEAQAAVVHADFQRLLIVDGVLTGYALFEESGKVRYLLHPRDDTTGVRFSALAMIHAILEDLFTPAQAVQHLQLIDEHLNRPDGVGLFDRPMPYHGGPPRIFQRAETATFFGREIGLMYTHAHLRHAQALAHVGAAEEFFHALCQANPIGIRSLVPTAGMRQANCYYSSSDAAFEDRYHASAEYERVARGEIALDGGWRVYSSGAGIALSLIMRRFLGISPEAGILRIDPVMPAALNGLRVARTLLGHSFELCYRVGPAGCGVQSVVLNGVELPFRREPNPHRRGAALVPMDAFREQVASGRNLMVIDIA